jgi:hypothetical protein
MFVELCMQDSRAVHTCLVVTKNIALVLDRNTKVMQSSMEINNLINTSARSNKLRTIGGSLDRSLLLRVPINRFLPSGFGTSDRSISETLP